NQRHAVTISFLTLAFSKLWFVFNLRRPESSLFRNDIVKNPYVTGAIVLCAVLLLAAVYLPGISDLLKTENPTRQGWLVVLGMSLVPFVFGQTLRIIQKARRRK
ncbi:MAG: cation-translocating P-type ATPase C-terminal domain-containing protein, partial [Desulfobacterales bacterium]